MISNVEHGIRGVNIRPSARKSIHAHAGICPFAFKEKVLRCEYIQSSKKFQGNTHHQEAGQGIDVVDNTMSKMAYPINSVNYNQIQSNTYGKNSFAAPPDDSSDESEDANILSTTSPAIFPSLHCSEELYSSALQNENNTSHSRLQISSNSISKQINRERSNQNNISTVKLEPRTAILRKKYVSLAFMVVFVLLAIGYNSYSFSILTSPHNMYSKKDFYIDIENLGAVYKVNSDSILRIRIGISTILEKEGTSSFIFVYDSIAPNYNPTVFRNFMDELASKTVKYLRNDSDAMRYLVVDTKNIETEQELMDLVSHVENTGVMFVPNVHNVPSDLAMAFHYYCDEYNPLAKGSAIFFTLDLATCHIDKKLTHPNLEKCLSRKWHNIDEAKMNPLLTRVINIIIDVTGIAYD